MQKDNEDCRFRQIKEALASTLGIDDKNIARESRLVEDLGVDSLDMLEMVMTVEDLYDIAIPEAQVWGESDEPSWATVQEILAYVEKRLGPEYPVDGYLKLTDEQFDDRYKPERNADGSLYRQREWDGGEDEKAIKLAISQNRCWTVVEDDDGGMCTVWGNRTVNRIYNVLTEKPIENKDWHVEASDPEDD